MNWAFESSRESLQCEDIRSWEEEDSIYGSLTWVSGSLSSIEVTSNEKRPDFSGSDQSTDRPQWRGWRVHRPVWPHLLTGRKKKFLSPAAWRDTSLEKNHKVKRNPFFFTSYLTQHYLLHHSSPRLVASPRTKRFSKSYISFITYHTFTMGKSTTKDSKKAKTSEVLSKVKSGGITKPSKTSKSSSKELAKAAAQKLEKSKSKKKKVVEPESSSESESSESESESEASSSESESSEDEKVTKKPVTNGKPKAKAAASSDSESESESESDSGSDSDSDSESEEETKVKAPAPKVNGTAKKVAAESSDSDSDSAESDSDSDSDESEDEKPAAKVEAVKKVCYSLPYIHYSKTNDHKAAESDDSDDSDDSEEDSDDSDDSDDSESDDAEEKKAEAPSKKRKAEEEIDEAPKKAKSEGQAATTLFVGSLSWGIDDDALYEAFKSFEPANARVVTDKNDGRSRGFGYVDFNDAESATKAYEAMQGQELEGRALNLDYANARTTEANPQNRAADRAKKHGDTISPESDTLFVGNLPFDVDQDIVREFFGEVAEVASVRLPTDP